MRTSAAMRALLLATAASVAWGARPPSAGALQGGPDAFGYCFVDSDHARGPSLKFRTLAGNGGGGTIDPTASQVQADGEVVLLGDDQLSALIPLPFDFTFYGTTYSSLRVSSNGFVTFGDSTDPGSTAEQIPSATGPNNLIAAYWANLNPTGVIGAVTHRFLGETPETAPDGIGRRVFDLQFTRVPHTGGLAPVTFQIELFEGTNEVEVRYPDTPSDGSDRSAGIENPAGDIGLQYRFGDFSFPPSSPIAVRYLPPGDRDGDGLSDCQELMTTNTKLDNPDSDGDGFGDGIEVNGGTCLGVPVSPSDPNNPLSTPILDTGQSTGPLPYPLLTICP